MKWKTIIPLIVLHFWAINLHACKCDEAKTVKEEEDAADLIVVGRVISQMVTSDLKNYALVEGDTSGVNGKIMQFPSRVVTVLVSKLLKGKILADTLTIITPVYGSACGVRFETDKQYIIFGTSKDKIVSRSNLTRKAISRNVYWTHRCSGTNLY